MNAEKRRAALDGKTLLITGGTGSFGREIVRRSLTDYNPKRVIVFSRDELKQHEMRSHFRDSRLTFFLGDVRDKERLYRAFQADVDVVIHAAALKQVPACEYNPFEAIKTNVLGAQNIIDAAIDCEIPHVLALSTDKAVNPANIYGASKLCAEKLFIHGNSYAGDRVTRFCCVRYGNVLGSRGSALPVFLRQRKSGVITVTDKRMTRFWIRLDQAVEFVVSCIATMRGGEVFVPRIPSMSVIDMVQTLAPECSIRFTGIRPGEKLHECLVSPEEARHTLALADRFVILPENPSWRISEQWKGELVPPNFTFTSDQNESLLTPRELLEIVDSDTESWHPSEWLDPSEQRNIDTVQPTVD
ncbi:MAG: UDP-N-acetylglucosamine 4,6-dehydratase (inverting) [Acidobacteriota bacterium]